MAYKRSTDVRSGLIGSANIQANTTLVTPVSTQLLGDTSFLCTAYVSPFVSMVDIPASSSMDVNNRSGLSVFLVARATPVQTVTSALEVRWLLDNIGGAASCCDSTETTVDSGTTGFLPTPDSIDDTDSTYFYWRWDAVEGGWLVKRTDRATAQQMSATQSSNPSITTGNDAWIARGSLTYV